jgi:hypothetical protein
MPEPDQTARRSRPGGAAIADADGFATDSDGDPDRADDSDSHADASDSHAEGSLAIAGADRPAVNHTIRVMPAHLAMRVTCIMFGDSRINHPVGS